MDRLHPCWSVRAVFHLPRSRFGVPGDRLGERARHYLQEGQAFTVYAGHSGPEGLWSDGVTFLDRQDWARLTIPRGTGVFVSCACFGCQLCGADGEGYALSAVRNPGGPVAVIGAHGESYAALGKLAFDGLLRHFTTPDLPERLGACWLGVQAGIARGEMKPVEFKVYDDSDGSKGKVPLEVQRPEHLEMWTLLGDPALRLPALPADVRLTADEAPAPGRPLTVRGTLPARLAGAAVRVAVERPLSGAPADLEPVPDGPPQARARATLANHERANRVVLAERTAEPRDGRFECRLDLPARLPWPRLVVRAYAANERDEGLGVLVLTVPP
jgi:hypothetical protein